MNFSFFTAQRIGQFYTAEFDFGSQVNFRIGIEAEFIRGFNKNKWAIICEPTYQSFTGEATYEITDLIGLQIH